MAIEDIILGVISFTPCSGYQMKAEFDKGGAGMLSSLSFGSIYPRLKQLERDERIEVQQEEREGRRKKVYELTAKGWQELAQWLEQPSEALPTMRDELLLKMIFWGPAGQDRAILLEHLQARRWETQKLLDELRTWQKNGVSFVDEYAELVFSYSESRLETELAWLNKAMIQLEGPARPPLQDPNDFTASQKARRARAFEQQRDQEHTSPEQSQE